MMAADQRGKEVQVDPIKPTLKAPGSERLKLKCDDLLLNFAFKFNLRRYSAGSTCAAAATRPTSSATKTRGRRRCRACAPWRRGAATSRGFAD